MRDIEECILGLFACTSIFGRCVLIDKCYAMAAIKQEMGAGVWRAESDGHERGKKMINIIITLPGFCLSVKPPSFSARLKVEQG